MKKMSKIERVKAAITGEEVDRVPISLWQHFPWADQDPKTLAETQLAFQKKFDLDFVKCMPFGLYSTADYNKSMIKIFGGFEPPIVEKTKIKSIDEWGGLSVLDPYQGVLGEQIKNLEYLNEGLNNEVPFVQTIFSPLTTLVKIGGSRVFKDIETNPDLIHEVLKVVCKTTIDFSRASIEAGASGLFFATQCATEEVMTVDAYKEFGLKYDLEILEDIKNESWFNIFHLHGVNIMTDIIKDLPVQCINWHDRRTYPSLKEGLDIFAGKCLMGGINEKRTIMDGTLMEITDEIYDAIEQTSTKNLIITPGCVAPTRTPHANYYAARMAVETYNSEIKADLVV